MVDKLYLSEYSKFEITKIIINTVPNSVNSKKKYKLD